MKKSQERTLKINAILIMEFWVQGYKINFCLRVNDFKINFKFRLLQEALYFWLALLCFLPEGRPNGLTFSKVNPVQEAYAKCFVVHLYLWFTYQNLKSCKPHEKTNQKVNNAKSIDEKLKTNGLMFFVSFFHVICKISNFNMWAAKHLAQASCTELTLPYPRN